MATLQDIADRVGVSKVTVSNVLRGKVQGRGARTAAQVKRIQAVAEELNYRVDWRARALKTKRTQMIGLLSMREDHFNLHNEELFLSLLNTLSDRGYSLVLVKIDPRTHGGTGFDDARFDGLLIDYFITPQEIEAVQRAKVPALIINAPGIDCIGSVMPDHRAAGRLAARALLDLGHRRLAHVRTSEDQRAIWPQHMTAAWAAGVLDEMRAAGLEDDYTELTAASAGLNEHERHYLPLIRSALASDRPPTGFIADSGRHAANGVLRNLTALGVRCPEDASVLCMEELDGCTWTQPSISALKTNYTGIGHEAAMRLVDQIEKREARPVDLAFQEPQLIRRESIGPPPDASEPGTSAQPPRARKRQLQRG